MGRPSHGCFLQFQEPTAVCIVCAEFFSVCSTCSNFYALHFYSVTCVYDEYNHEWTAFYLFIDHLSIIVVISHNVFNMTRKRLGLVKLCHSNDWWMFFNVVSMCCGTYGHCHLVWLSHLCCFGCATFSSTTHRASNVCPTHLLYSTEQLSFPLSIFDSWYLKYALSVGHRYTGTSQADIPTFIKKKKHMKTFYCLCMSHVGVQSYRWLAKWLKMNVVYSLHTKALPKWFAESQNLLDCQVMLTLPNPSA